MKRLLLFSAILTSISVFSCTKDNTPVKTKSVEDYLVGKSWKIQEITFVQNNQLYYYLRGGSGNTASFPNDVLVFNADGTGTYTTTAGDSFHTTWDFQDSEKSKINYTVYDYDAGAAKTGSNLVVRMENVNVSDSTLKYAEIYTNGNGNSIISSVERMSTLGN